MGFPRESRISRPITFSDGEKAYIYDRRGYAKEVTMMKGSLSVDNGEFVARLTADGWGDCPARAILTLGFTGNIVE